MNSDTTPHQFALVTEYLNLKAKIEYMTQTLNSLQEEILTNPDLDFKADPRIRVQTTRRVTVSIKPELRNLISPDQYVALSEFRKDKDILPVLEVVCQLLPADVEPTDYYSVFMRESTFIVRKPGTKSNGAIDNAA